MNANRPCRLLVLVLVVLASRAQAATQLDIDTFSYSDNAAVRAAWVAQAQSPLARMDKLDSAGPFAVFPCDFTQPGRERCYWDRDVSLNLSRFHSFALLVYCADPQAAGWFTLYFRSGDGWYAGGASLDEPGWNTLVFDKPDFSIEGSPAGWDRVDGIRLSPWRGKSRDTSLYADRLWAYTADVMVVKGTKTSAEWGEDVDEYCAPFLDRLREYDLRPTLLTDEDVESGMLDGSRIAIFPYNPVMSDSELDRIEEYVGRGGKLFACCDVDDRLEKLLGIRETSWSDREACSIRFSNPRMTGLPEQVLQESWGHMVASSASAATRIIARWEACEGAAASDPALFDGPAGVYFSHVLLGDDPLGKSQMLLALIAHHVPALRKTIAGDAIAHDGEVGRYAGFDEACRDIEAKAPSSLDPEAVLAELAAAKARHAAAWSAYQKSAYPQVIAPAFNARRALISAYALCQRPASSELRAVWNHTGTGVWPGDWARSARQLADSGFNAVIPNMLDAGSAHYPSALLPRSATFREYGDQIAQCLAACKPLGIEVHVWKVNWNLYSAPEWFYEKMKSENRTQVDVWGEEVRWLCPSHPLNRKLEADSMLEVASRYGVDGIHFDYIRYPDETTCYCDGCRSRFETERGSPVAHWPQDSYSGSLRKEYRDWRAKQITALVREVHDRAKALKPQIRISAAVFSDYPSCRKTVGQDWLDWIRKGYLDTVHPMDYTPEADEFSELLSKQMRFVNGAIPVYPGIGACAPHLTADQVIVQILETRQQGTGGFTVFNYDSYLSGEILDLLACGATHPAE
ncbi:MAG: family 10 glycosylhydrolase [Acidobacteriota bacterium]